MADEGRMMDVSAAIEEQVTQLLQSKAYRTWSATASLAEGDLVVFNNSFLYREGITGHPKNEKYLGIEVGTETEPIFPPVVTSARMNAQFRRIPARRAIEQPRESLGASVAAELDRLGSVVFVLVGRIGDDQPVAVPLVGAVFDRLRYEPTQAELVRFDETSITVNRLDDVDVLWNALGQAAVEADIDVSALAERFEEAIASLSEEAGRPVDINDVRSDATSIIGDVIKRLDEQVNDYQRVLAAHLARPDDAEALNELLRISYNFADGASALIALVVGICDLKPLIFWLTIASQFELAARFGELPFALVGKAKPSLARYRSVIPGARNRAFHDLFSFERPFHVRLTGDAFRAAELRLFQDYRRRRQPVLRFADRPLIELLEGFTRAPERQLPLGFWEGNNEVMKAVASVARSLQSALIVAATATGGRGAQARPDA
jgi:hypothetical protein